MARKKTPMVRAHVKAQISGRLREIRQELFGEHGGPDLARRLNLPARTWYNYETGVTVPAEVLLAFIDQTGTNPVWLFTGEGPRYRGELEDQVLSDLSSAELIRRGLEKLEQEPSEVRLVAPADMPPGSLSEFVAVEVVEFEDLMLPAARPIDHILAYRQWITHPRQTVAVRLADDAMTPVLPAGSIVAIDRANRDVHELQGRLVAAALDGRPMIRWLDLSGRHLILRPNHPSRENPLIPIEHDGQPDSPVLGQVIWSWSRFDGL